MCAVRRIGLLAALAFLSFGMVQACRERATSPPQAPLTFRIADSLQAAGEDSAAAALFLHLRDSLTATGDSAALWHSAIWGGYSLMHLGRTDSAGTLLRQSLAIALSRSDSAREAWSRSILSNWWDLQGEFDSAFPNATRARQLAIAVRNDTLLHSTSVSLGRLYKETARYRAALALHESTYVTERALGPGHDNAIASDLNELCLDYRSLGRLIDAITACKRGLELDLDLHRVQHARLLLNLGIVYADVGDNQRADSLYRAALAIYQEKKDARGLSIVHSDMGNLYLALHEDSLARREYALEDSIGRAARLTWAVLGSRLELANVELEDQRPARARSLAEAARTIADGKGYPYERVNARIELSNAEVDLGHLQAAIRWADEAVRLADSLDVPELEIDAREARGLARQRAGHLGALRDDLDAIQLMESWRGRLVQGDLASGIADLHLRPFESAIGLLLAKGDAAQAFRVSERAHARILRQLLAERGAVTVSLTPRDSLVMSLRAAYAERADADPDRRPALDGEIARVVELLERLDHPGTPIGLSSDVSLADLQRALLSGNRGLLAYFWGDSLAYGWWISRGSIRVARLGPVDSLAPLVDFLHDALMSGASDSVWVPAARNAYRRLVAPLAPDTGEVIVVPDGLLARIPFEALWPEGLPAPWGADRRVVYGPSATVLLALAGDSSHAWTRTLLAVANPVPHGGPTPLDQVAFRGVSDALAPLPFGEEEARAIGRIFQTGGADLLIGTQAGRNQWLGLHPERYRYLHFATHALVSEVRPELTHLVLADGGLDLSAIQRLRLKADLVTLSACETGLGTRFRGEGMIGLSHAFLAAGSRHVVVTLWRVEDRATRDFMVEFYAEIHAGADPAEAIQAVRRRWMLGGGANARPSRWAPFILVGAPGPP